MAAAAKRALNPRIAAAPILAVASGKGGVGKTWLSVSLACAFARRKERALLVDCDLGLANIDVQLGVRPEADLSSVMRGWLDLDAAVTPVLGGPAQTGGFDLLPGHSGSGALGKLPPEEVARLSSGFATLAPLYDRVILDLAAGLDPTVMRFARAADRVLVVATDEPTSMTDAYAFMKVLRLAQPGVTPWLAINKAENRQAGRRTYEQLAKAAEAYLGFRPSCAGVIQRDPRVADSIRAQMPTCVRHPQSVAFEDVLRVAESLAAG